MPSVTLTVIGNEPVCVGVPERRPAADNVRPVGSEPLLSENVAPPIAPDCEKFWLKAVPAVPVETPGLVTVMVWQLMTRLYAGPVPVQPFESVTRTVIGKLPFTVGVPEIVLRYDETG